MKKPDSSVSYHNLDQPSLDSTIGANDEKLIPWQKPHISKIYEALTAIADSRIELVGENSARCYSSSRGKFYEVHYDPTTESVMSNDNTAYYTDAVSYPMLALLMVKGKIHYNQKLLGMLEGIHWKDVNQKFKNDYDQAIEHVLADLEAKGVEVDFVRSEVLKIYEVAANVKLNRLGNKIKPPEAY